MPAQITIVNIDSRIPSLPGIALQAYNFFCKKICMIIRDTTGFSLGNAHVINFRYSVVYKMLRRIFVPKKLEQRRVKETA